MRISDWSSDVCSSDLGQADVAGHHRAVFDGFTDELAKGVVDLALERAELAATGLHQFMLFGENNATPERSHVDFSIEDQERTQPVHPGPEMGRGAVKGRANRPHPTTRPMKQHRILVP